MNGAYFSPMPAYDAVPRLLDQFDPSQELRVRSALAAASLRSKLREYVWPEGFPTLEVPMVTAVWEGADEVPRDLIPLDTSNVAMIDRLDSDIGTGMTSRSYMLHPKDPNIGSMFVIVHQGHVLYEDRLDYGVDTVIEHLLENGFTVIVMQMPMQGWNSGSTDTRDHNKLVTELQQIGVSPIRPFVEPVIEILNLLTSMGVGDPDVTMIGLSGGGWTTTIAAAADPRIRTSIAISGSHPLFVREVLPSWDHLEQTIPELYADVATYLDLYVLAAHGQGREHIQVLSQYDPCCFYGLGHKSYVDEVARAVEATGSGSWQFYLDSSHRMHKISYDVIRNVIDPVFGIRQKPHDR